jgi:hypothetical protein
METADSNSGSDRYGLAWGYLLGAGREPAPIDSTKTLALLPASVYVR